MCARSNFTRARNNRHVRRSVWYNITCARDNPFECVVSDLNFFGMIGQLSCQSIAPMISPDNNKTSTISLARQAFWKFFDN